MNRRLRRELWDLLYVAAGAIPGALLRWQLELLSQASGISLRGSNSGDLLANLLGCLCLGMLLAQPGPRARLYLWGGIGFCGSLTTFSSWMLELVRELDGGRPDQVVATLSISLLGGWIALRCGHGLGLWWLCRARQGDPPAT